MKDSSSFIEKRVMNRISVDDSSFRKMILDALAEPSEPVIADVITTSKEVEAYWPVLEQGSREGQRPWPHARKKTVKRKGRIFSRQAPEGFIGKNREIFQRFLREEFLAIFEKVKRPLKRAELIHAANNAVEKARQFLKKVVPVDKGEFRDSISTRKAK